MYGLSLPGLSMGDRTEHVWRQLQRYKADYGIKVVPKCGRFDVYVASSDTPIKIFVSNNDATPFDMVVESGKLPSDAEPVMMELGAMIARTLEEKILEKMR